MTTLNVTDIKNELVVLLRNADVLSTTERGVTTTTDEFNGDGSETEFTLTNTNVRNVRSVTVGGTPQTFGTDYIVNYATAVITFITAPTSGTNNVDIQYDYGSGDKIYGDIPRTDITLSSYPRIAVQITSSRTTDGSLDGSVNFTDYLISIYVYAENIDNVETYMTSCRTAILSNKKDLYYLRYITPTGENAVVNEPNRNNKIDFKVADYLAYLNEEIN
jgi:hypothetical protein